jgi:TonB family protein
MSDVWTRWEGQTINGVLPLRRYLGGGDHSGVFLSEFAQQNLPTAAVKLVPEIPSLAEAQLAQWRAAASLSHPHLLRILDSGRCQLGELRFLFVVMEYAEENLAQILPRRALTADEVREMLVPVLDALAFLHRNGLVHGQLKPSNILAVSDQLKLASDSIRPAGAAAASIVPRSVYDPPESTTGGASAAGDIWSLGVTLIEALTQHLPTRADVELDAVSLPAALPATFVGIVRRCLNRRPAERPTVAELQGPLKRPPAASPPRDSSRQRSFMLAIAAVLIAGIVAWAGLRLWHRHANIGQPVPDSSQASSQPSASAAGELPVPRPAPSRHAVLPSDQRAQLKASTSSTILHEELPRISRQALATIRGHVWVAVRVTVAPSGAVVGVALESPGPSKYFAQRAVEAARQWKFAPADNQPMRYWLLRFEFTRAGTTVHATSPWSWR